MMITTNNVNKVNVFEILPAFFTTFSACHILDYCFVFVLIMNLK